MNGFSLVRLWRTMTWGFLGAGFLTAYPLVLVLSFLFDGHPPGEDIAPAAVESWSGQLVGFRHDPRTGLIAVVRGPAGTVEVLLAGIETWPDDLQGIREAVEWLKQAVQPGRPVAVFLQRRAVLDCPDAGHLVLDNEWINGALVEQGLARVKRRSPMPQFNVGRSALIELQGRAQLNQAGIWRCRR